MDRKTIAKVLGEELLYENSVLDVLERSEWDGANDPLILAYKDAITSLRNLRKLLNERLA
jgi:hypothetical protein